MNKAYRIVWNACTNTWTAVQENAKAKGKSSSGRVSAEPATLGSLGLKSSRFVCTALVSALMMTAGYANAGPGIFINDGNDAGCIVTSDESVRRNALFFLVNNNLEWAAGQNGGSMPGASAFQGKCTPGDAATQINRALFYGDAGGAGSKHLSLGGRLDVNSGIIGLGDRAAGNNSIRIGSGNTLQAANSQSNSVAIGNDVETKAAMAVGIGPTAKANGQQSVAVGNSVEASGNFSVAIGTSARANAAQTVALGNNANAAGEDALAIGRSANAQAKDSIAFGRSSQAAAKGVAIGSEASAAVANSVALGSGTTAVAAADQSGTKNVNGLNYTYVGNSANSSVTVGNRQIKQVGAGEVSATSADAINGSQLYATQNVIGNIGKGVATNLGGGAALKSDGTFTAPTYNLTDASGNAVAKNNVGDALDVLNSRMNTVGTPVALNSNPSTGQVAAPTAADANKAATAGSVATAVNNAVSALESKGLQIDADSGTVDTVALGETVKYAGDANIKTTVTDNQIGFKLADNLNVTSITTGDSKLDTDGLTITGGPSVTKTGINAGGKTITNVAAGTVSATSTDAATGGQVYGALNNVKNVLGSNVSIDGSGNLSGNNIGGTGKTTFSDAIAAAYSKADAANAGWKFQVNSGAAETIRPNDTVGFKDGTNIAITNNGKDLTIATKPNLTADSLTINGNGPVINGNGINTNGKNIDMGNNGKITNLTSGNVAAGDNSAVTGGAVNTAINTAINTAVTGLKDAGFKIGADSGTDDTVKLGETVKYAGDANIKTTVTDNQIGFKLADSITVGPASGGNPVTVDGTAGTVTGLTNKTWNPASITSGRAATEDQLKAIANQVSSSATHYYSVNDGGTPGNNFNNDGATASGALAAGVGAAAQQRDSVAIGTGAKVDGSPLFADAVAIGTGARAQGNAALAIGPQATVTGSGGQGGIAIGAAASSQNGGMAIGSGANSGNGTALIPMMPDRLNNNLALGDSATVKDNTNFNVALGSFSTAGDADLTAAAYKPTASSTIAADIDTANAKFGEVSLGGDTSGFMAGSKMYRRLTNLAAGSADTDAVNVSQLKAVQVALQDQAPVAYTKADGTKVYKHTDGNFYDAPNGAGNQVAAADVITSLQNAAAGSTTAPTTLANVKDNLADTAAAVTNPTGNDRTTLSANKGHNAATVNDVLNAGFTVQGNGVDEDFVTHGDTVNFVNGQGTVANVSSTGGVTTVKFDTPMTYVDAAGTPATTPSNKVNLVGTGGPVTLGNVAAGAVNATSTDAVNGSQLYKTANSTATHLGGGSAVQADGSISAPTYTLANATGTPTNYSNVGDALTALNARTNVANAGWKFQVNSGAAETIKPNDTVGFKDGTNIAITNNGKDITIATKPNLTADSLTINNGPVINGNGISTNGKNIDMGNNGKITNLTSGNVAAGDNSAVTGGAVNTAINTAINTAVTGLKDAGFKIGADSGTDDTVKLGETVKYAGDANIKTTVTDNQIGFKLADNLNVTSITTGDSKLDTDGLTIIGGPSVTKTGINAGGKTITNVAAGTVSATSTDAATGGQVYGALNNVKNVLGSNVSIDGSGNLSGNNIGGTGKATLSDAIAAAYSKADAANAGWKFQVNSGAAETIKPNDTVEFKDGTNIAITNNGKDITIATNPNLTADSLTINGNGPVINGNGIKTNGKNIDMGNNGKITNLADGSIAAGSKDAITGGQLHTALNNISNAATNLIGTTQPDIVTYDVAGNKADNTNNVKQAIDKMNNGGIKFFHVNDGTGTQTTAGTQPATEDSSASGRYGAAVGYQAKASGESGVAIGKGAQATAKNTISIGTGNIVSGEGSGAIGDPTTITGAGTYTIGNNNGTVSANAAGAFGNDNTLTGHNSRIIGNHNIVNTENTFVVGNNVSRATANSVVLGNNSSAERVHTTATTPGSNYTFGGLNDANVAGVNNVVGVVSVGQGAAGSDASVETRQIQNVAAGVVSATSTDAINGSQLYHTNQAILNGVNGNLANLGARIGQVEDAANAGTAAAMAMAGLPQAYLPGKSMMAVGGSVYRGESGYAIGYSTISDGGNWIIKGTATGNSRGHYGATAAVGYQW